METGKLTLIPTPIGNLEDITLRAIRILSEVDVLLAEDTRHTGKLLQHLEIQTKLESLHQHNEHQKVASIIQRIQKRIAHRLLQRCWHAWNFGSRFSSST
jgi:16S rRNA (cytidine1402-2'-O)-methyltransferase